MDGQRFDRWTRSLVTASSRRSLVKGLAGAVVAVFAAGAGEIEAAPSCRGLRAGARCGTCGACDGNGTCVPNSDNCGDCKVCHPTSFRCTALPADTPCAACKTCQGGRCLEKRCGRGKRCCPSSSACVATGGCCTDAECGECGTCEDGTCRSSPGKEGQDCGGSACKVCRGGQCVVKPENANCPGGKCCGGTCRANAACCTDEGCDDPDCGKCENFRCDRTAKNDRPCGNAPACHICKDGHCVNKPDNSNCQGSDGSCCGGACCIGNQICCEGQCCAGTCLPLVGCCGSSSFTAAGADLCCPFGPPCGEGNDARCCTEGQECCRGECKAPEDCCPEENVCGDACCESQEVLEVCTRDGCCAFERGEVACGPGSADDALCCGSDEQCCPFAEETACCPEADACCFGDCCEPGMKCIGDCFHQTGRGCCPQSYPEGGCDVCVAANPGRTDPR